MGMKSALRGWIVAATVILPGAALAHSVLVAPPPRDVGKAGNDAHKIGSAPCGNVARTGTYVQYDAGASIEVDWKETVDHIGCFQIALSTDDDKTFKVLQQLNDEAGTKVPAMYKSTVVLPAGMTCKNCTLQVRQLMQNGPCQPDADPSMAANGTYFSCADICVGTDCPPIVVAEAGADASGESSSSSSSSGAASSSSSSGDDNADSDGGDEGSSGHAANTLGNNGGCSTTSGLTSGAVFTGAVTMLGLAIARRRKKKS